MYELRDADTQELMFNLNLSFAISALSGGEIEWMGTAGITGYNGYMPGDGIRTFENGIELKIADFQAELARLM